MLTIPGITRITYISEKKHFVLIYNFGTTNVQLRILRTYASNQNVFLNLVQLEVMCLKQSERGHCV